jgi:hypothetical protein
MKRYFSFLLAGLRAVTLTGCFKTEVKIVVNNDATGTISSNAGYSLETLEKIAEMVENLPEGVEMPAGDPLEQLEKIESEFTEKKMVASAKENGVEVTSSKQYEKDGWKYVDLQGKIKDVNAWVVASEKSTKSALSEGEVKDSPLGALGEGFSGIKFYKTDKEGVGEVELMQPMEDVDLSGAGLPGGLDGEEVPEGMDEMIEAMVEGMKERFGLNDLSMKITVTLPGKVLKTTGCTKDPQNEKQVSFSFSGASISMDGVKDMFGMKKGVRATFQIPKDCKIKFQVRKAKPAKKAAEDKAEKPDDKKKKKGGLGIGEDDGGK